MESDLMNVLNKWMEGEIKNFIKVWISIYISLSYCYFSSKIIPKGFPRLLTFLPVIFLFLALPLNLDTIHLGGMTAFFIAWLSNFKLLMFAFDIGPLSHPSLSLLHFLAIGSLPIKIKQTPSSKTSKKSSKSPLNYAIKFLLVVLFIYVYDYTDYIHPKIILFIYCFHIYFLLEIVLAVIAVVARVLLGAELEPQFNEPYLSTSLQDFWGRRWNIMVTRILRPTVYDPTLKFFANIFGRQWAPLPAILATFIVSAVMHELIFYYLGRTRPTWVITWFFLLHGVSLLAEIAVKKAVNDRWQLPEFVSGALAFVFVFATGFRLFLPELLRCKADVRAFQEYAAVGAFVKDLSRIFMLKYTNVTEV